MIGSTYDWLNVSFDGVETITASATGANTGSEIRFANYSVCVQYNRNDEKCIGFYVEQGPIPRLSVSPVSWNPNQASQSQNFKIEGSTSIPTISESATWLSISNKSNTGFTATVTANTSGSERNTTITISVSPTRSVSVSVRQSAGISASISPSGVATITPASGELTRTLAYTITSNDLNKIGIRVDVNWIVLSTISRTGGFTATINFRRVNLVTGIALAAIDVINTDDDSVLTTAIILIS